MRVILHDLLLELDSRAPEVRQGWKDIFDQELADAAPPSEHQPDLRLSAEIVDELPSPARIGAITTVMLKERSGQGFLSATEYQQGAVGLRLARPAQIEFDFGTAVPQAHILLTPAIVTDRHLEDVTLIGMAPLLRRRGLFLVHAFAVCWDEKAALIVGPSGSGKTTTGLAALFGGWQFLANDAALLQQKEGVIWAMPSPGPFNIAPETVSLLPRLHRLLPADWESFTAKAMVPRRKILNSEQYGESAPVTAVFFPTLAGNSHFNARRIPAAIGLARMLEESVDRWDAPTMDKHLELLAMLAEQARFFEISIPRGRPVDPTQLQVLL